MRMNTAEGKRLLACVREGDFAHPGEIEAVELVWSFLPKNRQQKVLDAGCGRGGTAALIQSRGWGVVTGIDIEAESIAEASRVYPEVNFVSGDVTEVVRLTGGNFQVITAFNAFYAFPAQSRALSALRSAAEAGAILAIFDYVEGSGYETAPFARFDETRVSRPLKRNCIDQQWKDAGWEITRFLDLHNEYLRWYRALLERFDARRSFLDAHFEAALIEYALGFYHALYDALETGSLSGGVAFARAVRVCDPYSTVVLQSTPTRGS
jgi:SAM-dependent methyltransferase